MALTQVPASKVTEVLVTEVLVTEERGFSPSPSSDPESGPLHLKKDDWVTGVKKRSKSTRDSRHIKVYEDGLMGVQCLGKLWER